MKIELHETGKGLPKNNDDLRMKQEKRSPSWRFYETHIFGIFEKFSTFGQKNVIYVILLQQNSDSSQRKKKVSTLDQT